MWLDLDPYPLAFMAVGEPDYMITTADARELDSKFRYENYLCLDFFNKDFIKSKKMWWATQI